MAYYRRSFNRSRRYSRGGYGRRFFGGFRRSFGGFRRSFGRFRTRFRTIYKTKYKTRFRNARRSVGRRSSRSNIWATVQKLVLLGLICFGAYFVWTKWLCKKIKL
ncbi:MAG: hypothetical protein LBN74_04405 [Prevotella sp.]|jgi:hypothetical protein|nr:hypothetical protein [Prevotella sp.]